MAEWIDFFSLRCSARERFWLETASQTWRTKSFNRFQGPLTVERITTGQVRILKEGFQYKAICFFCVRFKESEGLEQANWRRDANTLLGKTNFLCIYILAVLTVWNLLEPFYLIPSTSYPFLFWRTWKLPGNPMHLSGSSATVPEFWNSPFLKRLKEHAKEPWQLGTNCRLVGEFVQLGSCETEIGNFFLDTKRVERVGLWTNIWKSAASWRMTCAN